MNEINYDAGQSVLLYGAVGDSETDNTEAFKRAMEESPSGIYVPAGKYCFLSDLTIDVPVILAPGVLIRPDVRVTVTFAKFVDAGIYRVFAGDGSVKLEGNGTVYPEWFGAKNDGTTDCTDAIQSAIDALPEAGGRVEFMPGTYSVKDTITITESHVTLSGLSRQTRELSPMICSRSKSKPVLHLKGKSGGNPYDGGLEDVTIEYLEFTRAEMGEVGSDTILLENTIYTTIQHTGFAHSQNGVRAVNVNGLRLMTVHATTGGDLPGAEVRGVFIDGSKRGSTGILINDFIYYAYASPSSKTYGYKDVAKEGAIGGSVGDRRISNFECDGSCDYGIYMESAGDFACDVSISEFTMDGIDTCGIFLKANNAYNWQQVNITNAYFRLSNESGKACAITAEKFAFVHATNCHIDNAGKNNDGIVFKDTYGCTVTASSFSGNPYNRALYLSNCNQCSVTGNTSNLSGKLLFSSCKNSVVAANAMPAMVLNRNSCTGCIFDNNLFS